MRRIFLLTILVLAALPAHAQRSALVIYGGANQDTYLGCLTCIRFNPESVCRAGGRYGSHLSPQSIWNQSGTFGGQFSPYSPWNPFAKNPPVVLDKAGNRYGLFWVNTPQRYRVDIRRLLETMNNRDNFPDRLTKAREAFCQE